MPEWRDEPLVEQTLVAPPPVVPPLGEEPPLPPDGEGLDRALAIGLTVLLVLVLGGIAAAYLLTRNGDDKGSAAPTTTQQRATVPTTGGAATPTTAKHVKTPAHPGKPKRVVVRTASVPGVVGLSAGDAASKLAAAGFKSRTRQAPSKARPGTVLSQAPAEGTNVKRGDPIVLTLAKALPKVTLPDLVGVKRAAAKIRLKKLGLVPQVHLVPTTDPPGHVIAQHPKADALLAPGTRVRINVGRAAAATGGGTSTPPGTTPTPTTTTSTTADQADVPDVTSLDEQEAAQELQDAGFQVETSDRDTSEQSEDGLVLDQTPAGGGRARAGSTVTIVVGRYSG